MGSDILQTTSLVYEYDFTLSKFLDITHHLAGIYFEAGRDLPEEKWTKESVLIDCMNTTWTRMTATDEAIGKIALRWRQLRLLRQLYLDDVVAQEFRHFRAQFALVPSAQARAAIVEPGVVKSSQSKQSHHFGLDFKARFHKSLCLHSMAIASRNIAKAGVLDPSRPPYPHHLKDLSDQTTTDVCELWTKTSVVIGGEKRSLSLETRLDCLEVFDFLYLFLLKKVIPFDRLEDWLRRASEDWPYAWMSDESNGPWYYFLNHCRWTLQPLDLVDLIKNQAWTADAFYPQDKIEYIRVRSFFDLGTAYEGDWYSGLERFSMVHALLPGSTHYLYENTEDGCWWDMVRLDIGPPFQPEYTSKFLAQHKMRTSLRLATCSSLDR